MPGHQEALGQLRFRSSPSSPPLRCGMGYRELSRMEIIEVVRHWQAGTSPRGGARVTGVGRETVKKYLAAAETLGMSQTASPALIVQRAENTRRGDSLFTLLIRIMRTV